VTPRPADSEIPPDEWLYHRVRHQKVDGDRVLPAAVRLPSCSVNRAKYSDPEDVIVPQRPECNGVAEVQAGNMPEPITRPQGPSFHFQTADCPREGNDAHAEIRLRRGADPYSPRLKIPSTIKSRARSLLAAKFRVSIDPTAPA